jgi:hypothetical protein
MISGMNLIIRNSRFLQWILLLVLFGSGSELFSQQNLGRQTIVQFDLNNSVLKPDAPMLTESVPMEEGRYMPRFVNGVGGVSFDQVAFPEKNILIKSLNINYNSNKENGSRLILVINGKLVKVTIPDWMLVPIAKYADSPYYSCVTLFGKLNDNNLEKQVTDHKGRVINYHPALENTLLGIRLAYMDMLLGYSFTSDLPKNSYGNYILGTGEITPDVASNQNGAFNLSQSIIRIQNKYMLTFRSYIISDYSRQISFKLQHDSLLISGYPYYYCWRFNCDAKGYDINKVAKELSTKYNQKMKDAAKSSANEAKQDWLIDRLISVSEKYDNKYSFYTEGTFVDLVKLRSIPAKKQFLLKYTPESLLEMIVKTEAYMNRDSVIYLKGFSDDVSSKPELFETANPAVWNATVNTMRFAAFFRYVKANFPKAWLVFQNQIAEVDPEPRIFTPTIMYNSLNKEFGKGISNKK